MSELVRFPHELAVIGDDALCTGFRLAGVRQAFSDQEVNPSQKLEELLKMDSLGIIVVSEKIFSEMDWRVRKTIWRTAKPVVIAVPDKSGPAADVESLKELVRKALGFELIK
ncbi:MAG: hypothetical protein HY917_01425 [Candidatus Diapherotrites archaeon]|nr:hypothetical protein [Candidatus Diapherotrites archaeon]